MGRPLKRKFFGTDNVNDGQTYSLAGGEGVQAITDSAGSKYSQGLTATIAPSPIGGIQATISSVSVYTANGSIQSATVGVAGTGYDSAPAITLVKPANVAVKSTTASYYPDGSNVRLSSTTGIYVGMAANTGYAPTATVTTIYTDGNVRMSAAANIAINTAFSFGDTGSGGALTSVLFNPTTTANTIQANAWVTGGTIGKIADIVSQRGSRRYKVTNVDGTDVLNLVGNLQIATANGPVGAGQMSITVTDSANGTYYVKKLFDRTAIVHPVTGTQFALDQKVSWIFTGTPVANVSVKISTNN